MAQRDPEKTFMGDEQAEDTPPNQNRWSGPREPSPEVERGYDGKPAPEDEQPYRFPSHPAVRGGVRNDNHRLSRLSGISSTQLERELQKDRHSDEAKGTTVINGEAKGGNKHEDGGPIKPQKSQSDEMSGIQIFAIMFSLCMALFLAALDVTIITTALPTIARHFTATASDYTWIGSSFIVACAGSVPVWGKLSDIFGRKPAVLLANFVFFAGSILSATAVSIKMLIAGRVIQGIGGGGLIILVNIVISDLFSMRERGKYLGIVGATWAIASATGPLLGGVFTEKVSWRWCFYINLPLDGIAFVLLLFFLKVETPTTPFIAGIKAIDWPGVLTIVGGVVMFLLGLDSGGVTRPWNSAYTLGLIVGGVVSIVLFFVVEWKVSKYPLMPLRLFANSSNLAALAVCFCHGFTFIGGTYYLPLYFQTVLSASPILSGVYLLPLVLTLSSLSALVGIFTKKTGKYQEPIWFGMGMMTLGFGLLINIPTHAVWAKIVIYQMIAGIGVGPNFQSPLIALQSHVARHDIATATATFGFVRQLATAMSVVLGGVVFQNTLTKKQPMLLREIGPKADLISGANLYSSTALIIEMPPTQKVFADAAITSSFSTMFIFYTAIAGFGLIMSLFIKKHVLSKQHQTTKTGLAEQERVRLHEKQARKDRKSQQEFPGTPMRAISDAKSPRPGASGYEEV